MAKYQGILLYKNNKQYRHVIDENYSLVEVVMQTAVDNSNDITHEEYDPDVIGYKIVKLQDDPIQNLKLTTGVK